MKFSDIPYFLIKEYFNIIEKYKTSNTNSSYLIGGRKSIIASGGDTQEFFVEDTDYGFRSVLLKPYFNNIFDDTKINFEKYDRKKYSNNLLWNISNNYYSIQIYELSNIIFDKIENGNKLYFRKDSSFYEWLSSYANETMKDKYAIDFILRNYINTDKSYIYFGDIYANGLGNNTFNVIHYNIHNYINESIPEHQKTEKLQEFNFLNFDIIFNEMYNSLRDLFSLIDPFEVKEEYLQYIIDYFDLNIDNHNVNVKNKRELTNEAINLIKSKGTYHSLEMIWKILTNNTKNRLNLYERWIYKEPFTEFKKEAVIQNREKSNLGFSSVIYPNTFKLKDEITTNFYNGLLYLKNAEIIEDNLKGNTWTIKNGNDQYFKYGYSVSQVIDDNKNILYPDSLVSLNEKFLEVDPIKEIHSKEIDKRIELSSPNLNYGYYTYNVKHNLKNQVISTVFDGNNLVIPHEIKNIDENNIQIKTINELSNGYVNIIKSQKSFNINNDYYIFITHNLDSYSIITQVIDEDNNKIIPKQIKIEDKNSISLLFNKNIIADILIAQGNEIYEGSLINLYDNDDNLIIPDRLYENSSTGYYIATFSQSISGAAYVNPPTIEIDQEKEKEIWEIEHNLDTIQLIIQIRNDNDYIIPEDIEFTNYNNIKIKFNEPTLGTAIIGKGYEFEDGTKYKVSKNAWIDYLYKNVYEHDSPITGAGEVFYNRYRKTENYPDNFNEKLLSTHYLLQADLTTEPLNNTGIFEKLLVNYLYEYWENFRPVNNVAHYNILISPIVDLSNKWINLYKSSFNSYFKSKSNNFSLSLSDTYIGINSENITWTVNHNLNTENAFVQVLDDNLNEIFPSNIETIDKNTLKITFDEKISGYVLVKKENVTNDTFTPEYEITIKNSVDQKEILTQIRNNNNEIIIPNEVRLSGNGSVSIDTEGEPYIKEPTKTIYFSEATTNYTSDEFIYYFNHQLNELSLLIDVYDNNNRKIYPNIIERINNNKIKIVSFEKLNSDAFITIDYAWGVATHTKSLSGDDYGSGYDKLYYTHWNIKHNLNTKNLIIQVTDLFDNTMIPNSIEFIDNNEIELTFNSPTEGNVLITKTTEKIENIKRYKVRHNQLQKEVLAQFRDNNGNIIYPDLEIIDDKYIGTNINTGEISFLTPDVILIQSEKSNIWNLQHNLNTSGIIFSVFDENNNKIIPDSFSIIDKNNCKITFDEKLSGYVILSPVGNILFKSILEQSKFSISNEQDNLNTSIYTDNITEMFEDGNYYYLRMDIPKEKNYSIKSVGILNNDTDELIFYSECSEIYKKENMTMTLFYKISKEII